MNGTGLLICFAIGVFILFFLLGRLKKNRAESFNSGNETVKRIISEHIETLSRRYLVLVRVDPYGFVDKSRWNKEAIHFIDNVLKPKLPRDELAALDKSAPFGFPFLKVIETMVVEKANFLREANLLSDAMTPVEFEHWCKRKLEKAGWSARTTVSTGDQGADVVVSKGGRSAVLQCKLYSRPVGNKAVQEAFSAKRHYGAEIAAVVTNAEYTRSAKELAGTTGVLLLHTSDLSRLEDMLPV